MANSKNEENSEKMHKELIRDRILSVRENLSTEDQINLGKKIIENFLNSAYHKECNYKDKNISLFNSFKGEPDLNIIRDIFIDRGARCYYPITLFNEIIMSQYLPDFGDSQFYNGRLGIREPELDSSGFVKLDIVFIPGIVFDFAGNRIGFGKGYYDKYLSKYQPSERPLIIALIYDFQLFENIPSKPHDIPVDLIITEKKIVKTNQGMKSM